MMDLGLLKFIGEEVMRLVVGTVDCITSRVPQGIYRLGLYKTELWSMWHCSCLLTDTLHTM